MMNKILSRLSIIAILFIAGCVAPTPYHLTTPFAEGDFQPWAGSGPATLQGQAFLKTVGGDVKTCAGAVVVLIPANAYDRELIQAEKAGYSDVEGAPQTWARYAHQTRYDAQGNFLFADVPALTRIIETSVSWGIPTESMLVPIDKQGGVLNQEVSLRPGINRAILTAEDEVR